MKLFQPAAMFVIAIAIFTGTANAQKKPVKKPTTKKPPATKTVVPPLDVRAAREKVDVQLSNVNDFEKKLALDRPGPRGS